MRRVSVVLASVLLAFIVAPVEASAHRTASEHLHLSVAKAPIAPDGTIAGAPLDFVVAFADPDPAVDGVAMKVGGTIAITLDEGFDLSASQGSFPTGPLPPAILLQGWPQSPRVSFPYTTDIVGNTITLTMAEDWAVGDFGPGPKAVHLALFDSPNPSRPGRYLVDVAIQPDPGSPDTLDGRTRMRIDRDVQPSINVVSLFSGPPGPPPPFFNPLFQDVAIGDDGRQIGMYLWDGDGEAALNVDIQMRSASRGRLIQDGKSIGQVTVRAPRGASDHTLVSTGPSVETPAFVTGIPTGLLISQFTPDPAVAGTYTVTFRMWGGNKQVMHYDVG